MSAFTISLVAFGTALGSGLVAGVLFGFSSFIMRALARIPAAHAVEAMQAINVTVINRGFLGTMFGTAALALLLAVAPLLGWGGAGAWLRAAGSLFYLFGVVGVTLACNVPRNDALAAVSPGSAEAAAVWGRYLVEWTRWNHVRSAAGIAAATLLTLSLWLGADLTLE